MPKNLITWDSAPEDNDYPAALTYLSLIYPNEKASELVKALKKAPESKFMSKDIFRASGLSLLGVSTKYVKRCLKKVKKGKPLSPVLLVRDTALGKVIVADGYHRLCAVYSVDENEWIHCRIVTRGIRDGR